MSPRTTRCASNVLALALIAAAAACGSGTETSASVRPGFAIRITDSTGAAWSGTGFGPNLAYIHTAGDTVGSIEVVGGTYAGIADTSRRLFLTLRGRAFVPIPARQSFIIGGDPATTIDARFDIVPTFEDWTADSGRILIEIVDDSLLRATASLRVQSNWHPGQKPLRIKSTIVVKLPGNAL